MNVGPGPLRVSTMQGSVMCRNARRVLTGLLFLTALAVALPGLPPVSGPHPAGVPSAPGTLAQPSGTASFTSPSPTATSTGAGAAPALGASAPLLGRCLGVWAPSVGQAAYRPGCSGHDEPAISFYSDQPGSAGNLTWNVTLPVDRSPAANQSDLYSAAWFGMTLSAPGALLDQCYLEIQLYPDFSWASPNSTVYGSWGGSAVAWQIDPATGYETPCFAEPLYLNGLASAGYFNMTQGDRLQLTLSGWTGSPYGENVSIQDLSNGLSSRVNLYDRSAGQPLDPAYSTNDWSNSLEWTSGGELPVAFGFEIGHAGNTAYPSNSTYQGCSPGTPPSTPSNGAVPCPSYDPGSWANDTAQPWKIHAPLFSGQPAAPAEVAFSQDLGGAGALASLSNGSCAASIGSADCSYPWFSYSCGASAFEFGATDYPGVTTDFGKYAEYTSANTSDGLRLAYYPSAFYSVPSCSGPGFAVRFAASGSGSVHFLGTAISLPENETGLTAGAYGVEALPTAGQRFLGWTGSTGVTVNYPLSPLATIEVTGSGTLTASFGSTAPPSETRVWFNDSSSGTMAVYAGAEFTDGVPLATETSGAALVLPPGLYGIQAEAPRGSVFTGFAGSGGLLIASPSTPYTWMLVTGGASQASLLAGSAVSSLGRTLSVYGSGNGTVSFNGSALPFDPATDSSAAPNLTGPVGSYPLVAVPASGWSFLGWSSAGDLLQTDFGNSTNITLGNGTSEVTARFGATVDIRVNASAGGTVLLNDLGPQANGSTAALGPGSYKIDALPAENYSFAGWSVSDPANLWVIKPSGPITHVVVNDSGTLTAAFVPTPGYTVSFGIDLANAGTVSFNGITRYAANTTNQSVAPGAYLLSQAVNFGFRFLGWNVSGSVVLAPGILTVRGNGSVVAEYAVRPFPVTFVGAPSSLVVGIVDDQVVPSGGTVLLDLGTYPIVAELSSGATFSGWSSNLPVGQPDQNATNLTVTGPGTVSALVAPFALTGLTSSSAIDEPGLPVTFRLTFNGTAPTDYAWSGLPGGCPSADAAVLVCRPASTGAFSVAVEVTGSSGFTASSNPVALQVIAGPSVASLRVAPASGEVGQSRSITLVLAGGLPPYAVSYQGLPPGCTSTDALALTCAPTAPGGYVVQLSASDTLGGRTEGNVTLQVLPHPTLVSFAASPGTVTAGVPVEYAAVLQGGLAPFNYSYAGLPTGCASANRSTLRCIPTAAGTSTTALTVTDAAGYQLHGAANLVVNPRPGILHFGVTPNVTVVGGAVNLTVSATGGTGGLTYAYTGLPSGCLSQNSSSLRCIVPNAGTWTLVVTVTDADGVSTSATANLTATAGPAPLHTGSPPLSFGLLLVVIGLMATAGVVLFWVVLRRRSAATPAANPDGSSSGSR